MTDPTRDSRNAAMEPLVPIDPAQAGTVGELVERMRGGAFGARQLGEALDVLRAMAADRECLPVLTLSGAMTIAKMGPVICEMIERGLTRVVISTGAIVTHSLSEALGGRHYRAEPGAPDRTLAERRLNRIYDTLEPEANLDAVQHFVAEVAAAGELGRPFGSQELTRALGKVLHERGVPRNPLSVAYRHRVPIYVPALTDSELGLDLALAAWDEDGVADPLASGAPLPPFNPFMDLRSYVRRIRAAPNVGMFTVGGGVPRNWGQQAIPFLTALRSPNGDSAAHPRIRYGIRICPEPTHWGGLSGSTYAEAVSWGKCVDRADGGRFSEVYTDATIAWPLLIRAYLDGLPADERAASLDARSDGRARAAARAR